MNDPIEALRLATEATADAATFYAFWGLVVQSFTTIMVALGAPFFGYMIARLRWDMQLLEKNTNSIKDALVDVTRLEAHARGVLDEKTRAGL